MGIRSKNGDSAPNADISDARHSRDESSSDTQKTPRPKRDNPGRRLPFAPNKAGKAARNLMQTDDQTDAEFEAACLAMVLNKDQSEAERPAQASPRFTAPVPQQSAPEPIEPIHEAARILPEAVDIPSLRSPEVATQPVPQRRAEGQRRLEVDPAIEKNRLAEAERHESALLQLRAQSEHQAALIAEHRTTIERQEAALAEHRAEISILREDLPAQDAQAALAKQLEGRDDEIRRLRQELTRTESESASQTEMLMHSLHETEAQREAEVTELSSAAQSLSEAQRELGSLRASISEIRASHEATLSDVRNEYDTRLSELRQSMTHKEVDAQNALDALRRTLDSTEAQRKANAAELVSAAERKAEAEQEILELRRTVAELSGDRDTQLSELRDLVSRREIEKAALEQSLVERETEFADLHNTMIQRDIDALKLTEQLRKALLHSEAQRESDAASLLEIMAQREAAEYAERANDVTRKHLAGY